MAGWWWITAIGVQIQTALVHVGASGSRVVSLLNQPVSTLGSERKCDGGGSTGFNTDLSIHILLHYYGKIKGHNRCGFYQLPSALWLTTTTRSSCVGSSWRNAIGEHSDGIQYKIGFLSKSSQVPVFLGQFLCRPVDE